MHSFLIGLQFLTRIRFVRQTTWTAEDFGRSTRFFPLVGLVLGLCYMLAAWVLIYFLGMRSLTCVLILILPILLTGGIHADGFMDTADGVFSGRERERKLEIMKEYLKTNYNLDIDVVRAEANRRMSASKNGAGWSVPAFNEFIKHDFTKLPPSYYSSIPKY